MSVNIKTIVGWGYDAKILTGEKWGAWTTAYNFSTFIYVGVLNIFTFSLIHHSITSGKCGKSSNTSQFMCLLILKKLWVGFGCLTYVPDYTHKC